MNRKPLSSRFSALQTRLHLFTAMKVGLGSALAIFLAYVFSLPNPASAGTITLLTLLATNRKDTLHLIGLRIITFILTVFLCCGIFQSVANSYLAYGMFLLILVFIAEMMGWSATLSVNSVIGAHFLINRDFSFDFIGYEFVLLMISILIALVLNFIQPDRMILADLNEKKRRVDTEMKVILLSLADRVELRSDHGLKPEVLGELRENTRKYLERAVSYSKNSFKKNEQWYLHFFELRFAQYAMLHECSRDVRGLNTEFPVSAEIAAWIRSIADKVASWDDQKALIEQGRNIKKQFMASCNGFDSLEQPMILLFILDDLEEFLVLKRDFVQRLSIEQRESYKQTYKNNEQM